MSTIRNPHTSHAARTSPFSVSWACKKKPPRIMCAS